MSLVQKHQQQFQQQRQKHESESRSSLTDCRYQPTLGEVCVGGGSGEPIESFRIEREIQDPSNSLQRSPIHLHRGRSVSTDDLSTEWNQTEDGEEPSEWRRVSKIRRSFQFPKSSSPKPTTPRPPDLPENSVSVSRIREELENGRRLSTAMRNNHVDLVALDSILNGTPETDSRNAKKSSFLTAESLKEIRGKLKKLSDESLYKDDFVTQNDIDREKDEKSESSSGLNVEQPVVLQDSHIVHQPAFQYRPKLEGTHTTNSLENRTRYRDTTSSEWHLRRKSYGFEKMTPQEHSIFRSEPSTDSGIGRSGELSNWSPTENTPRTTIIKFGENPSPSNKTTVTVMANGHDNSFPKPIVQRRYFNRPSDTEEVKRHSIAVDESKYVRDNLRKAFDSKTSVHLNGLYVKEANSSQVSIGEENGRKQKRVEFCKTEVHFAAESGRVNIVETDGKPPPTNNFRRRRRSSGGTILLDAMSSGLPVIHFGDEKKTLFEQETAIEETLAIKNNVTVSLAINNGSTESTAVLRDEDEETSDEISLRGILKNKPVKPKPYHLGENIESNDSLWGVRLRPVTGDLHSSQSKDEDEGPTKLPPADAKPDLDLREDPGPIKSVAERIRIVEERKGENGYSTKINLNMSNSPYAWSPPDTDKHHQETVKPIQLRLEEHTIPKSQTESRKLSHSETVNDGLKSTSLIMKTIKSANQFDEAMKRLQQPSNMPTTLNCTATKLISNMHNITKSSSANSIFQEQHQQKTFRPKYSSSLDGDIVLNDDEPSNQKIATSSSSSSFVFEKFGCENTTRPMEILKEEPSAIDESIKNPIAAPRVKVIGSSSAVSHQLSQLRRMYDAADFESDDSAKADEEVKLYLGGGTSSSSEEKTSEFSGSWSRLKVQRSHKKQSQIEDKVEVPKSNVLSIELRSPTSPVKKSSQSPVPITARNGAPVAQPRSLTSVKTTRSSHNETTESTYQSETVRSPPTRKSTSGKDKTPLKVGSGGARKLREHELSYFGVKVNNYEEKPKASQKRTSTNTEANRKSATNPEISSKWKLPSDKPDLLRHSPDGSTTTPSGQEVPEKQKQMIDGPIYENLKKPSTYNRKKDLQRDEMILNEMTKTADQTLKAVTSTTSNRDHQKRSSQISTKPLDTIEESRPTQSRHQQKSMKSKAVQVSRPAGEGFQRQCCSNRPSSASSTESLSRLSSSGSLRRSRSRSRDTREKIEYADIKPTKKAITSSRECSKLKSRSINSHDAHRIHESSSEDLANVHRSELARKVRHSKEKDRRVLVENRRRSTSNRTSAESEDKIRISSRSGHDPTRSSHRSVKPERVERISSSRSKASPSTTIPDSHQKSRTKSSAGVVSSIRSTASAKRPNKDHPRK